MLNHFFQKHTSDIKSKITHPLYFLMDFCGHDGKQDILQNYIKREPNYDLAFCSTWQLAFGDSSNQKHFEMAPDKEYFLVDFLNAIQDKSLSHLPAMREVAVGERIGYQRIHGRAEHFNYYGLVKDRTTDEAGVKELIEGILSGQKQGFNELRIVLEEMDCQLVLKEDGLYVLDDNVDLKKLDLTSQEVIDAVLKEYHKGACSNQQDRLCVIIRKSLEERMARERGIFSNFLADMKKAETDETKIKTIALVIRDLMQLHLYWDGNGRSLFLFANWLLHTHHLPLFYPTNMCVFDANSIDKMYKEIIEGQQRFTDSFGTKDELTEGLNTYRTLILDLEKLIYTQALPTKELSILNTSFAKRELNLLFRQLTTNTNTIGILKFLLDNADALHVNIFEKGKASGKDALDVAKEHHNEAAIELLSTYWPAEQASLKA